MRSQEVQADTQGLPTQASPSASGSRGCLGGLDPQNKNPFCSLRRLLPAAGARHSSSFQLRAPQVCEAEVWREGGPAQVPSNPSGVPTPPVPSRVVELTSQTCGPAPPASPTFRRPLGSAHAGRLRSSARKGRFVRAPRHRAARAADPGTRLSRGRD